MNQDVQAFDVLVTYAFALNKSQRVGQTNEPSPSHESVPGLRYGLHDYGESGLVLVGQKY
jgi:hypothetical protein